MRIQTLLSIALAGIAFGAGGMPSYATPLINVAQVPVNNAALVAVPSLSQYIVNDLQVFEPATADWSFAQIRITLTSGSIYNVSAARGGTDSNPNPALWAAFPESQFDTFVTSKGFSASVILGGVDSSGNATPGGTQAGLTNNGDTLLEVGWGDIAPTDTGGPFTIGRFTFSKDAIGTVTGAFVSDNQPGGVLTPITGLAVINGVLVPEPSATTLVFAAFAGLLVRRYRRAG